MQKHRIFLVLFILGVLLASGIGISALNQETVGVEPFVLQSNVAGFVESQEDRTEKVGHDILGENEAAQEKENLGFVGEGPVQLFFQVDDENYRVRVLEGSTVYDVMELLQNERNFQFSAKNFGGLGFFVSEIQGVPQNAKERMYWIYYVNGKEAQVGVSQYIIKTGDVIEWRYEKEK